MQNRYRSTGQEFKSIQNDERVAAMLHGNKRNDEGKDTSNRHAPENAALRSSSRQPATLPRHNHNKLKPWEGRGNVARKRKAGAALNQSAAKRQRSKALELKDEAYIRSTMTIPTPQEYPNAPKTVFKNPRSTMRQVAHGNQLGECRSEFTTLSPDAYQCTAYYKSAMHNEAVIGEGRTQKAAENTAWLLMVAKFHEQGVLGEILDKDSGTNQVNKQSMKKVEAEEKEAIIDIYNYAARFDTVPKINATLKARSRRKPHITMTVELPEQGIRVEADGVDLKAAEVRAAKMFKEEAEKYQKEHGSETIVIKDPGALTTDTGSKFMDFYRIIRRGVDIKAEATQVGDKKWNKGLHHVQVKINGEAVGEPVEMMLKKKAEETAYLTAAIAVKKREPELYPRFLRALRNGNGQILKPISPVDMHVDEDCSLVMRETLLGARRAGLPDVVPDIGSEAALSENRQGGYRRPLESHEAQQRSERLERKMNEFLQDPKLADLRNKKAELPMNQHRAQVLDLVNNNVYSIIVGATGSGKTTQVPQILLEDAISRGKGASCNIVCTQPRRIAAISVAKRVAVERAETLQDSVGYHVRFDAKLPQFGGSVTYCTTGILQQQLQHHPDEVMDNLSHLVIDEVHERDMLIDFLLILLKKNIMRRQALGKSNPQVVLMSATMDTELFASYFQSTIPGKGTLECPSLNVPGRTFPVKERYLDEILKDISVSDSPTQLRAMHTDPDTRDYLDFETRFRNENPTIDSHESADGSRKEISLIDWKRERNSVDSGGVVDLATEKENALVPLGLVACTIAHISKKNQEGAILVFLPGLAEIVKVEEMLKIQSFGVAFNDTAKFKICLLHSSLPAGQNTVFDPVPEGCRKIILGTNIAETSITIPDVQYVVDTGKLREKQYDQTRRISQLLCTWVSKSNSKQRAGRAGRVQNGNYYALFTKERYEKLRAIGLPELLRIDLQEICLKVKAQALKAPIREFLAEAIEPPDPKAVDSSIVTLQALDALTDDGEALTPLGRLLSSLPVHPSLGKMIVLGIIFRCLDPMVILGAASAERSLFLNPLGARQEAAEAKLSFVEGSGSDHIALLNAVRELRSVRDERGEYLMKDFAHSRFLHLNAFKTIDATAQQIEDILVEARLIPRSPRSGRTNSQFGGPSLNENSHKIPLIKALALAGLHPNIAINNGGISFRTVGEKACIVHPNSVNASRGKKEEFKVERNTLYMYSTMARSNDGHSIFLRDTTEATPLMATLFGGKLKQHEERGNIVELDGWLPFYVTSPDRRSAKILIEFRKGLERLLAVAFKELGNLSSERRNKSGGEGVLGHGERQETFLADEKTRRLFAGGLVEVLDRDVRVGEMVAKRGWGGERSTMRTGMGKSQDEGGVPVRFQHSYGDGRATQAPSWGRRTERNGAGGTRMPAFYEDLMKI